MSTCQLCPDGESSSTWECPVHDVPLAQGAGLEVRYMFQPWACIDYDCHWSGVSDDAYTAYSAAGEGINSSTSWHVPVSIPEQLSILDTNEGVDQLFFWTWAIRRALWRDLIAQGFLCARLHHYPGGLEGQGPTLWLSHTTSPPAASIDEWTSTQSSMVLFGGEWPWSDRLSDYNSLFDLDSLPLRTIFREEFDREELELSFEVEFEVDSGPDPDPLPAWASLAPDDQLLCVRDILAARASADMLWVEDVLACIAFHPGTNPRTLIESGILDTTIGREAVVRAHLVDPEIRALAALSRT